jgi:thiamine biosynthesis lipoprotein
MGPVTAADGGYVHAFQAMASPCEVRLDNPDPDIARRVGHEVEGEARRIEAKYSRYRPGSVLSAINGADGSETVVDEETAALLDYAAACFALSDGLFDVTSGVLRRVWRFDGSDQLAAPDAVREILSLVGWGKLTWASPRLTLPAGMEIDFGGLGKEYAVDRALLRATALTSSPVLINFGGDLRASGPRRDGARWPVLIENVDGGDKPRALLELSEGALTTSGDARRFLLKDGVRYSHILDPRTGWPVTDPPRSVTVAASTCMEAGLISTLAMLQGAGAEAFLQAEGVQAWWVR